MHKDATSSYLVFQEKKMIESLPKHKTEHHLWSPKHPANRKLARVPSEKLPSKVRGVYSLHRAFVEKAWHFTIKLFCFKWFWDIAIHATLKAFLMSCLKNICSHGQDRHMPAWDVFIGFSNCFTVMDTLVNVTLSFTDVSSSLKSA